MTKKERVQKAALEVLAEHPKGIRYTPLQAAVKLKLPDVPANTIRGNIWDLGAKIPDLISKRARGLYILKKYEERPARTYLTCQRLRSPRRSPPSLPCFHSRHG